jgi:DNA topoisomerase-1
MSDKSNILDYGISRKLVDDNYIYFYNFNLKTVNENDKERIKKLRIPPSWNNVWISTDPLATIQAIGMDNKGRKQYKYHKEHIEKAEKKKFIRLLNFIKKLPKLDKSIEEDKNKNIYSKKRVITTILTIIKELHMRVGKEEHAKKNKSYGASSMKKNHVSLGIDTVIFRFKGKSNQKLHYTLKNIAIKNHIKNLLKLNGEKLFQYYDSKGKIRRIFSSDINYYIQNSIGSEFSVKDFRTYAANLHFIQILLNETQIRNPKNPRAIKKNLKKALDKTAKHLKHTKSISKQSYVANFSIDLYNSDPAFFVKRKFKNPRDVLIELLEIYKEKIMD